MRAVPLNTKTILEPQPDVNSERFFQNRWEAPRPEPRTLLDEGAAACAPAAAQTQSNHGLTSRGDTFCQQSPRMRTTTPRRVMRFSLGRMYLVAETGIEPVQGLPPEGF